MIKFLPFVLRNLGRNKLRTALTGGAILLAISLVCVLRTMPTAFDVILTRIANNTRISIHNSAGIVYSMPYAYLNKVCAIPGVVDAVSWSWFGGALDADKGVTFPNFAVDADHIASVYEDYGLDPASVIFVGDRDTDMRAAQAAGVRGFLIPGEVGMSAALEKLLQ